MENKKTMPSKLGRVGRKKLDADKKCLRLNIWKQTGTVARLGGKKQVENLLAIYFETLSNA